MRRAAGPLLLSLLALGSGCAGGSAQPASPTATESSNQGAESARPGEPVGPPPPRADVLYAAPPVVPKAPASCPDGREAPARNPCENAVQRLAEALTVPEVRARDEQLFQLESCTEFVPGVLRALRAELGEAVCADSLVAPLISEGAKVDQIPGDVRETLTALGLGARLRRLAQTPPTPPTSRESGPLSAYYKDELFPWIGEQAQAIFVMASQGRELSGYARGIVAIEAGNADMRFVDIARTAPISEEIAAHEEARDVYYATLDEQLEPRKQRGRDAALVGLREMAQIGVRESERVRSARSLLSQVFGGRRVNALDTLLVPPLPAEPAKSDEATIAALVPSAYATSLIGSPELSANLVRAHLQMGMTRAMESAVLSEGDPLTRLLYVRALFERGRTYFRAEDFQAASAELTALLDAKTSTADHKSAGTLSPEQKAEARLLRALSVALMAGPKDAADMIATGPRFAEALGNLVLLDALGEEQSETGGRAAFNAGYLRELIAPSGAPEYFRDLAKRYRTAARSLKAAEKKAALERAAACDQIAQRLTTSVGK